MNHLPYLPDRLLQIRLNNVNKALSDYPIIKIGIHNGQKVVRIPTSSKYQKRKEHYVTTSKGKEYLEVFNDYKKLKEIKEQIESVLSDKMIKSDNEKEYNELPRFNGEFWNSLVPDSNPLEKRGSFHHKDIWMRSRSEVLTATSLDSLNLMYKYEPEVILFGKAYYPDFAVYIPELDFCFFIEVLGMADSDSYARRNEPKLFTYLHAGIRFHEEMLLIPGTENMFPSPESIRDDIISFINRACEKYRSSDSFFLRVSYNYSLVGEEKQ